MINFSQLPALFVCTRHPEVLHNIDSDGALRKGITNRESPLTDVGELQRDITAEYLRRKFGSFDKVFCSTHVRTRAIPVAAGFADILSETPLLDERNMGVWHTHTRADVLAMYPEEEDRHKAIGYYAYEPPGGESCISVEDALRSFLDLGILGTPNSTVYISGHGITGLCLRRLLTRASVDDWYSWYSGDRLKNASVSVYERKRGRYICTSYNYAPWEGLIDPELLIRKSTEA